MTRRDPAGSAGFVAARSAALHRTAYLMVGERQLAQDLLQEAFTKTYVAWPRSRDPAKAEAYTRKVITTTAISWYRRRSWQERPSDTIPESSHEGHAEDLVRREWGLATNERIDVPVDGRTVYVTGARGVMVWDALDNEDPVLIPAPDGVEVEVLDVQDGHILHVVRSFEPDETGGSTTMVQVERLRTGRDLQDTTLLPGTRGRLSPDGRSVALYDRVSQAGSASYNTTTVYVEGDTWTPVAPPGYDSVTAYQWLDADTSAASAGALTADFAREDLLSCEATTGECTVVVRGQPDGLVVATGVRSPS